MEFAAALKGARDFIAAGTIVCDHLREHFGIESAVTLFEPVSGRPLLSVDNVEIASNVSRLQFFRDSWATLFQTYVPMLRETPLPIGDERVPSTLGLELARAAGYRGDSLYSLVIPLFEPSGLFGWIVCGRPLPFTEDLLRALTVIGHHMSVRLAQLGVRSLSGRTIPDELTHRQFQVAELAARGHTNADISAALEMSENTVKKHLKDIFDRLGVVNRAELAARFASSPPREDVPLGISRRGRNTIMRFE